MAAGPFDLAGAPATSVVAPARIRVAQPAIEFDNEDMLAAYWDGPVLAVDWRGATQTLPSGSFVGERVAVPGDKVFRTIQIRNQGPSDATLSVSIDRPTAVGDGGPAFADTVILGWSVGSASGNVHYSQIAGQQDFALGSAPVGRCETIPITVGYEIPLDEVRGSASQIGSASLRFGVSVTMRGEPDASSTGLPGCPPVDGPTPTQPTGDSAGDLESTSDAREPADRGKTAGKGKTTGAGGSGIAGAAGQRPPWGSMPHTGATLIAPVGAALGILGGLILVWRRRKAESDPDADGELVPDAGPEPRAAPGPAPGPASRPNPRPTLRPNPRWVAVGGWPDDSYRAGRNRWPIDGVDITGQATGSGEPHMWSEIVGPIPDPHPHGQGRPPRKEVPRSV
jgi:hypothetical protein